MDIKMTIKCKKCKANYTVQGNSIIDFIKKYRSLNKDHKKECAN